MNSRSEILNQARNHVRQILDAALHAVSPENKIRHLIRIEGHTLSLKIGGRSLESYDLERVNRIVVVGGGKAVVPMAIAIENLFREFPVTGLVATKYGHFGRSANRNSILVMETGHPIPDENSLRAGRTVEEIVRSCRKGDMLICLISGGAGALMESPVDGISLIDLQCINGLLLKSGASIVEINKVRKHISRIKGGGLVSLSEADQILGLILSDVVGDRIDTIACGPTSPDPSTFKDALNVLSSYGIIDRAPKSIVAHLQSGHQGQVLETPKPGNPIFDRVHNHILASNWDALQAAAKKAEQLGFHTIILSSRIEGESREVGKVIAGLAESLCSGEVLLEKDNPITLPACVLLGGETTVTVRGNGKGGRNQEMALAASLHLNDSINAVIACIATDGTDGPTDAAGGLAHWEIRDKARKNRIDLEAALARNDSYSALQALEDLIITGPTGTNVNDIAIILAYPPI